MIRVYDTLQEKHSGVEKEMRVRTTMRARRAQSVSVSVRVSRERVDVGECERGTPARSTVVVDQRG